MYRKSDPLLNACWIHIDLEFTLPNEKDIVSIICCSLISCTKELIVYYRFYGQRQQIFSSIKSFFNKDFFFSEVSHIFAYWLLDINTWISLTAGESCLVFLLSQMTELISINNFRDFYNGSQVRYRLVKEQKPIGCFNKFLPHFNTLKMHLVILRCRYLRAAIAQGWW